MMEDIDFNLNITIVGLGLIGGSLAKALKELNPKKIYGIDCDERAIKNAVNLGIIDEGYINGDVALPESDLVIIALYPKECIKFVRENRNNFKTGAILTDTCGVKQVIIEEMNSLLPSEIEFVGGHPMAGKESKGLAYASKDLFIGSNYIITPHNKNIEESLRLIEKMAYAIGCKNVIRVEGEEHDRIISFTSHLPHVIAVSLMNSDMLKDFLGLFVGGSFKDATRVAEINSKLWLELFTINSEKIIEEIEKFEGKLIDVKEAIKNKNTEALEDFFNSAQQERKKLI
jgi:prephenate dehydrogenase